MTAPIGYEAVHQLAKELERPSSPPRSIHCTRAPGGPVRRVHCARHQKPGKPPVLRVGYQLDGGCWVNEWLPLESPNRFAQAKTYDWWARRAPPPPPRSVDAALLLTQRLRTPSEVSLARDGDFARVAAVRFSS